MSVVKYPRSGGVIEIDRERGTISFRSTTHRLLSAVALAIGSGAVAPLVVTRLRSDMHLTLTGFAWIAMFGLMTLLCVAYAIKSAASGESTMDLEKHTLVVRSGFGLRQRAADLAGVTFVTRRSSTVVVNQQVEAVAMVASSLDLAATIELVSLTAENEAAVAALTRAVAACVDGERDAALRRLGACAEGLPTDRALHVPLAVCLLLVPFASWWMVTTYLTE